MPPFFQLNHRHMRHHHSTDNELSPLDQYLKEQHMVNIFVSAIKTGKYFCFCNQNHVTTHNVTEIVFYKHKQCAIFQAAFNQNFDDLKSYFQCYHTKT